jgi:hypothetical protein
VSEPVTVVGTPIVTIDELNNARYGTIELDREDPTRTTLIVTPDSGNETAGLPGTFTFRVAAGAVKDDADNENPETTFILVVYQP